MKDDKRFAKLVALACHDLSNPLATVYGFGRTLSATRLEQPAARYVEMIEAASGELGDLLDELALVARIEAGRFDPALEEADTLELARAAAEGLGEERLVVDGEGAVVRVPVEQMTRGLAKLAKAAARHGGLDEVSMVVRGTELEVSPVSRTAAPVVLGEEIRELSAAAAVALIEAIGGTLRVEDERLFVSLPTA